jgi:hypothetical protein
MTEIGNSYSYGLLQLYNSYNRCSDSPDTAGGRATLSLTLG